MTFTSFASHDDLVGIFPFVSARSEFHIISVFVSAYDFSSFYLTNYVLLAKIESRVMEAIAGGPQTETFGTSFSLYFIVFCSFSFVPFVRLR